MRKSRKKKSAISLLMVILVMALTVLLMAMLLMTILSAGTPGSSTTTAASNKSATTPEAVLSSDWQTTVGSAVTPTVTDPPATPITTVSPVTTAAPMTTPAPVTTTEPSTGYAIDMSGYMDAVDPQGDLWDDAYLRLVNVANPITKNEEDTIEALKTRPSIAESEDYDYIWRAGIYLNETALKALSAMFNEAKACGIKNLDVTSGYRSYSYQESLFNRNCNRTFHWVCADDSCGEDWIGKDDNCPTCGAATTKTVPITREEQEASVSLSSCAPGTSDHQTGLAVDIVQTSLPYKYSLLIQEFGETDAGKWLAENCYRFGFVLRFPEGKEDITGIIYEPWHFRYVGRTHALKMQELDLCLEEYVEYLNSIGYFE